jgi:zinc protease
MKANKEPRILLISLLAVGFLFLHGDAFSAMVPVERIVLPNHLVVLVSEEHSLPMVTCKVLVDAGSWRDPSGKEGLANLTARALPLGTAERTASEINRQLDFIGATLDASCGRDFATLNLATLKKNLDEGFAVFLDALTHPTFPEKDIARQVQVVEGRIQSEKDEPGEVAEKNFRKALFLDSPYEHPVEGTRESLSSLDREALAEFHETYYRPNNAVLAVVGDVTVEEVRARMVPKLENWAAREIPESTFESTFAEGPKTVKEHMPISQANVVLGHEGIRRENPDHYAVSVMNHILGGGGLGSRLMQKIRVEAGLAYSVGSAFITGKRSGSFMLRLQTQNAKASKAVHLALGEMKRMKKEGVSAEELETAKKYLVGSFPLRFTTQSGLASLLVQLEYFDLGTDYPEKYASLIDGVTRESVNEAAREYLHPEKTILSVVANTKEVKGIEEDLLWWEEPDELLPPVRRSSEE